MSRQTRRRTLNVLGKTPKGWQGAIQALPELLPFDVALKTEIKWQDYRKGQKRQSQTRGR